MSIKLNRRKFLAGSAAVASAAAFPMPSIAQSAPVKIGLLTVKTGPLASGGLQMEQGIVTFLKQKNYTLAGRKVDFISADTGGNPAGAKTKAQELVELNKVDFILGPLAAFELLAITDYIAQAKTPLLSLAAAEDMTQRKPNPYFLRASACSAQAMYPMADYATKVLGYKTAVTISEDFAFGYEQQGGFQRVFEDNGGKVLAKLWPPLVTADYTPYLAQIPQCDVVCQGFAGSNPVRFMKQYSDAGLKYPVCGGETAGDDALLKSFGDEANGMYNSCPYTVDLDTPINKRFIADFQKMADNLPGFYGRPLRQRPGGRGGARKDRRQDQRQDRHDGGAAQRLAHQHAARPDQVRPFRQRDRHVLCPPDREGKRQAQQSHGQDLSGRQPVLDL